MWLSRRKQKMKSDFVTEWTKNEVLNKPTIIENPEEVSPDNFYNAFINNIQPIYEEFYY